MNHVGIDLHKMESQVCVLAEDGRIVEKRILTRRDRFEAVLNDYRPAQVMLEAATESEWVACYLESCGHEVVVADPNYGPMYAHRSQRIKTDRRDARALAEACRQGTYRRAHRLSPAQRQVRSALVVRDTLVRTRTRHVAVVRAELRRDGHRLSSGTVVTFRHRVEALELPEASQSLVAPLLTMIDLLTEQIKTADRGVAEHARSNSVYDRLRTVPGVGPLTAVAFVATLDNVERFDNAHQVQCYLGLVPRERSSGETQRRGRITKCGNSRMRWLLVEAAWRLIRSQKPEAGELKRWAAGVAARRGRRIAVVALARRLAGILFAVWRDHADFEAGHGRKGTNVAA